MGVGVPDMSDLTLDYVNSNYIACIIKGIQGGVVMRENGGRVVAVRWSDHWSLLEKVFSASSRRAVSIIEKQVSAHGWLGMMCGDLPA